ncbi:MFS transporter [Peribacillus psychrosaccharolyticus]|uniref:MFS transporter n=1 Tax=Peribacillus psychrosaccharolyticus TaxID=1407 RepID=A0A974NIY3_PERPY|nr:MFS transporter [Peribacillus psychrosaccharolyticus]MEC2056938.1 MFS transporter [Peribacillus psychrosaccharolyticus]MED3744860.1 MFS transporter [Peribacillus psychrosaccharolyticus]QQS98514.1 MFS transporter [Peribacillus psychrosaccharolyticus]
MESQSKKDFPLFALLALALVTLIVMMTEVLPAGLLPEISQSLAVSEGLSGQLVTAYALGSVLTAIPLSIYTKKINRKRLLVSLIILFLLFNSLVVFSPWFSLTLIARFICGIASGSIWGMIASYALRMVTNGALKGRGIAIASLGTPIALSFGVPLGTYIGSTFQWRFAFGLMSILCVIVLIWIIVKIPDFEAQKENKHASFKGILTIKGVIPFLCVVFIWMFAHNVIYTYIAPYLSQYGVAKQLSIILFVFGLASVIGIWLMGMLIDRHLQVLALSCLVIFAAVSLIFILLHDAKWLVYICVILWGLSMGGVPTLLQTALARTVGEHKLDIAMPICTTSWNIAITLAGISGGYMVESWSVNALPLVSLALLFITFIMIIFLKKSPFKANKNMTSS